jgi:hypothetical protein
MFFIVIIILFISCSKGDNVLENVNIEEIPIVYITGCEYNENNINITKIWINGSAENLINANYDSFASSAFVSNEDVYGKEYNGSHNIAALRKTESL